MIGPVSTGRTLTYKGSKRQFPGHRWMRPPYGCRQLEASAKEDVYLGPGPPPIPITLTSEPRTPYIGRSYVPTPRHIEIL
ncbi:hypothetical protein L1987_82260 [Smallanthus sonchifolius]|uniref:Uncharacterized protein n=1 Tax=Smallanthus sonchifolius TaxID=185202 RepID=A0ACB8YED9_9ASTR|nr:hypothetical protein L1987_82260 [Smallanthus sonchifolius]